MISEILDILANLGNLPSKENKPVNSEKNIGLFICYLISAICLIFLIPEFNEIRPNENSYLILSLITVASLLLALIGVKLVRKINLFKQQTFSKFLTLLVSLLLFCMLSICLIFNKCF
ncbi:hypothetical protein [Flavobacterium sp. HJJ]|uniref:hypothetical protein n=1 Tax=Flavobacterium sp. HJJ TaxID=2783792 RepID=UPI00188D25CD|nr:hypothetical protein [Flavobacterium sp. HJJ]MBF4472718.1 hypothetical protein [Flavobacterium sp. HJJ]